MKKHGTVRQEIERAARIIEGHIGVDDRADHGLKMAAQSVREGDGALQRAVIVAMLSSDPWLGSAGDDVRDAIIETISEGDYTDERD